jgi:hypothetical protein
MKIGKCIPVVEGIDSFDISVQRLSAYWEGRGMKFIERSEFYLKGKRGSLLGNLISFDMKHIISKVEIRKEPQEIKCELWVNTIFQYMTKANKRFFQLELETFERYLLFDDLNEEAWQTLTNESKRQDLLFILIFFIIGFGIAIIFSVML